MKRITSIFFIVALLLTSFGIIPGLADPSNPNGPGDTIYIPFLRNPGGGYSVSGMVVDSDAVPLSDVIVSDDNGNSAVTDETGAYILDVPAGNNIIVASRSGYDIAPETLEVNVTGNMSGQNFTAAVGCGDIMVNGTVNYGQGGWDFPQADPWDITTGGTDSSVFYSANYSGRTGIPSGMSNVESNSKAISQLYHLPSDADTVTLSMYIKQVTTSVSGDYQYIQILNSSNNVLVTKLQQNQTAGWHYVEFTLNAYIGQSIKVQVRTTNDGLDGKAAMYFDNVELVICKTTPLPPGCTNQVINPGFEGNGGWTWKAGQVRPPVYSDEYAAAGFWSMRAGIPLWAGSNVQSTSEFYQDVHIPSSASSATLRFYVYTTSEDTFTGLESPAPAPGDIWDSIMEPVIDTQYAYVLRPSNNSVLKKLFWWPASNTHDWIYYEYDVSAYIGQDVRILFGAYNDGFGGKSAIYVDQVFLDACDSGGGGGGGGCFQALTNRRFENNSGWGIPNTAYPAGYSTLQVFEGNRSMRAGIYYQSHRKFSYSDFYQQLYIPSTADSATLKVRIWQKSGEALLDQPFDAETLNLPTGINVRDLPASLTGSDLQYLLILDKWGNILQWKWTDLSDDRIWNQWTFNLSGYAGKTIRLQFGVFNNNSDGVTSMFVDDASLLICDP